MDVFEINRLANLCNIELDEGEIQNFILYFDEVERRLSLFLNEEFHSNVLIIQEEQFFNSEKILLSELDFIFDSLKSKRADEFHLMNNSLMSKNNLIIFRN